MENSNVEKIVMSLSDEAPDKVVKAAFFQTYLKADNAYDLGVRLFGEKCMPEYDPDDEWEVLFCYGAGYEGDGIYDRYAGFLLRSPEHGINLIHSYDFCKADDGRYWIGSATVIHSMEEEYEIEDVEMSFNLTPSESAQLDEVIQQWDALFRFEIDENEEEHINIISNNGKLPEEFKKNNDGCYVSGPQSEWEDGIGIMSEYWSFTAKFVTN